MTEADQRKAFLRAICEDPKDDAPRLMFADWLDEHGESERAEFIRVQLELAKGQKLRDSAALGAPMGPQWETLRRRERELLDGISGLELEALPIVEGLTRSSCVGSPWRYGWYPRGTVHPTPDVEADFHRGFVAAVALPADVWLQHADALCAACPLEEVWLTTWPHWRWSVYNADWSDRSIENEPGDLIAESALKKRWPRITFHLPEDHR